jgi:hypothetical protein
MADLRLLQRNEPSFILKLGFGVSHGKFGYFWGWKAFRKILSGVGLPFNGPVILCMHVDSPSAYQFPDI